MTLEANRDAAIKAIQQKIRKIKQNYAKNILPKYKPRFIRSMGLSITRGKEYEKKGKAEEKKKEEAIKLHEIEIERIQNMNIEEWYNSLIDNIKAKMVKDAPISWKYFDDDTLASTYNMNDQSDDSVSSELLDDSEVDNNIIRNFDNEDN